jgi:hypothetical protein
MASTAITTGDVRSAKIALDAMRGSLRDWIVLRARNDLIAAGKIHTNKPVAYARQVIEQNRDMSHEGKLAKQLYVLLTESFPDSASSIPMPDVSVDPNAAVALAKIAVSGKVPASASAASVGAVNLTSWPVLIVGGLLLAFTSAIGTAADVAKEKERIACIEAGACTDYGFWLKAGGVAALFYVAWQIGLGDTVKKFIRGKS